MLKGYRGKWLTNFISAKNKHKKGEVVGEKRKKKKKKRRKVWGPKL
jgi:ribosomal protein L20